MDEEEPEMGIRKSCCILVGSILEIFGNIVEKSLIPLIEKDLAFKMDSVELERGIFYMGIINRNTGRFPMEIMDKIMEMKTNNIVIPLFGLN
jgi:hypothetical protein